MLYNVLLLIIILRRSFYLLIFLMIPIGISFNDLYIFSILLKLSTSSLFLQLKL